MLFSNTVDFTLYYIYLNIIIYLIPLVLFYFSLSESTNSLSGLTKLANKDILQKVTILFFILNLAGIPPLPGFFIKLNIFLIISKKINISMVLLFTVINFIIFFFYIKNYRKLVPNKNKLSVTKVTNYILPLITYFVFYPLLAPYILINLLPIFF